MKLFHYNPESDLPAHAQIKEQVKVALALGKLQPGDVLPSIRSVEKELGIGRMLVRKAYQQLEHAGIVETTHGKGTVVADVAGSNGHLAQKADRLVDRFVEELNREGLEPLSFSRLFRQRLLAHDALKPRFYFIDASESLGHELAEQIQARLDIQISSWSMQKLEARKEELGQATLLCSYYYLENVKRILGHQTLPIYPVALDYAPDFLDQLQHLPMHSRVLLLFHERSLQEEGTQVAIATLMDRLEERCFRFKVKAVERVQQLERLTRSPFRVILVSNITWDSHKELFSRFPHRFWRLAVRMNNESLNQLRESLGLIV